MDILVVGSGGREHAIVHKLNQSIRAGKIYASPGNAGIAELAECLPYKATDIDAIVEAAKNLNIDLVFVAPDDPLALGMVDRLNEAGIRAFGPNKKAARLEGSKVFSKGLMKKYNIPTAAYQTFDNSKDAIKYIKTINYPIFIKADGLAVGKGAISADNYDEAVTAINTIMEDKVFGNSGNNIVIEEFMTGTEVTILAFTDGNVVVPMVSSQDHKQVYDNDEGPNTGGMGAFSPSRIYTPELAELCMETIFKPTINAMNKENSTFKGVIYFQLMITPDGPKVIEYNARFGDPEAQVVLPRLKTDLIDIIDAVIDGKLADINIEWHDNAAACVVMASGGYPVKYETGFEINLIENNEDLIIYHAGTKINESGKLVTNGGRVLCVTALAEDLKTALSKSYNAVSQINFKNAHYRKDIGINAIGKK
ncbi:MAG: phosphoribosylamine--glycine ligase [Oscillospiraceae bacterium]|nr:phosphoribosylamine--glycine ligase [Oscillospiraceae bacterium]